jgi:hypothetical protein
MRHRYRVDLYDDVIIEAQIADLVESMPRARRQEFLRTMIKVGYLNTYGSSPDLPSSAHYPSLDKKDNEQEVLKDKSKNAPKKLINVSASPSKALFDDVLESNGKGGVDENHASKSDGFNIPSILNDTIPTSDFDQHEQPLSNDEDGIVDSLDEFNGLFNDLGES